jgi:ribosomal protein L37AE/L43A
MKHGVRVIGVEGREGGDVVGKEGRYGERGGLVTRRRIAIWASVTLRAWCDVVKSIYVESLVRCRDVMLGSQ